MRIHIAAGLGLSLLVALTSPRHSLAAEPVRAEIEKLVAKLGSDVFQERSNAYQELLSVGQAAVPRLREAVKSEDPEVSRRAANLVEQIDLVWRREYVERDLRLKDLADVLRACQDERPYMRHSAAYQLYRWKKEPEVAMAFLLLLRDQDVRVRRAAAGSARCCLSSEDIVRALLASLKEEDEAEKGEMSVSELAASSLGCMDRAPPEVKDALIEGTKTGNDALRYAAIRAVGSLGSRDEPFAPQAVKVLVVALKGKDYVKTRSDTGLRAVAAFSLSLMKTKAKAALPDLIEALRAEGAEDAETAQLIRMNVCYALGEMSTDASTVVPQLTQIVQGKDFSLAERESALQAWKRIVPGASPPELSER